MIRLDNNLSSEELIDRINVVVGELDTRLNRLDNNQGPITLQRDLDANGFRIVGIPITPHDARDAVTRRHMETTLQLPLDHTHQSSGLGVGGKIDHGLALNGLGDDDHTQYLLVSGARAMAGDLNMGGFGIVDAGKVHIVPGSISENGLFIELPASYAASYFLVHDSFDNIVIDFNLATATIGGDSGIYRTAFNVDFNDNTFGPTIYGTTSRDGNERLFFRGTFTAANNQSLVFGGSSPTHIRLDTTNADYWKFRTSVGGSSGSTISGNVVFMSNVSTPENYPVVNDLHLRIQSNSVNANDYLQFFHDQTDANINWGNGALNFSTLAADTDLILNFLGTTNSGQFSWMEDEDYFKFNDDLFSASAEKHYFRATTIGIYSQAPTFLDVHVSGGFRIGDSSAGAPTNYAKFAPDGELTLVGTARVIKHVQGIGELGKGHSAPSIHTDEAPYLAYTYAVGDDSHISFEIPGDMDFTVASTFKVHWYTDTAGQTGEEVNWQISWNAKAVGEAVNTGATTDTSGDVNVSAQWVIVETTIEVVPANSISSEDMLGAEFSRVDIVDGDDPDMGSIHVLFVELEYTSNKLGQAI